MNFKISLIKNIFRLCLLLFIFALVSEKSIAQSAALHGAWQIEGSRTQQLLLQDKFYIYTVYQGNQFVMSQGGNYTADQKQISALVLFNSEDPNSVGKDYKADFLVSENDLSIFLNGETVNFTRIDKGTAPLAGVWRITGRMVDGKVTPVHQTGSRQTYKLLTGTKFQWAAIDPDKKTFTGTAGGDYTFEKGKYTEKIAFFSRDNSRVGASLVFDGKLVNGEWHHSGLSSKGDKIYEIWSKVIF